METVLEPDYADPSYNGDVVAESNELATLDQYWRERRTRYEQSLERHKEHAEDPAAEREWQRQWQTCSEVLSRRDVQDIMQQGWRSAGQTGRRRTVSPYRC